MQTVNVEAMGVSYSSFSFLVFFFGVYSFEDTDTH